MIREAFLKALVPVTIITFAGICALAPLYVTMSVLTRQMNEKINQSAGSGVFPSANHSLYL